MKKKNFCLTFAPDTLTRFREWCRARGYNVSDQLNRHMESVLGGQEALELEAELLLQNEVSRLERLNAAYGRAFESKTVKKENER